MITAIINPTISSPLSSLLLLPFITPTTPFLSNHNRHRHHPTTLYFHNPNLRLIPKHLYLNCTSNTAPIHDDKDHNLFSNWDPPMPMWRGLSVLVMAGQVVYRSIRGKIHWKNTLQQLERVGPRSVGVCLLTSAFVGMAFTIQFVKEFIRLGLTRSVGGVLALAFSRELSPVITSIVVAGRVGSAFAAELGTMQVSEQTDTLRVLGAHPVDYLVTPRVLACLIAVPVLTILCFTVGMASSALLADGVYGVSSNIILDSARRALRPLDIISALIKSQVFGMIIAIVSCSWGVTTIGGAKGVGESTTSAVVISLRRLVGVPQNPTFWEKEMNSVCCKRRRIRTQM